MVIFDQGDQPGDNEPVNYSFIVNLRAPNEDPLIESFCNESQDISSGNRNFDKQLRASCESKSVENDESG